MRLDLGGAQQSCVGLEDIAFDRLGAEDAGELVGEVGEVGGEAFEVVLGVGEDRPSAAIADPHLTQALAGLVNVVLAVDEGAPCAD